MKNPKVVWSGIQRSLEMAQSDVLILLDCCWSGVANETEGSGITELLCACPFDGRANGVGHYSFTQALTTELRLLGKLPRFSVGRLYTAIYTRMQSFLMQGVNNERYPPPVHFVLSQDGPLIKGIHLAALAPKVIHSPERSALDNLKRLREDEPSSMQDKRRKLSRAGSSSIEETLQHSVNEAKDQSSQGPSGCEENRTVFEEANPCKNAERSDREEQTGDQEQSSIPKDSLQLLDAPRALFAIRFREDIRGEDLSVELFREWLRSTPAAVEEVRIEASFKCFSTLILFTVPSSMSAYMLQHPAVFPLGAVTSSIILPFSKKGNGTSLQQELNAISDAPNVIYRQAENTALSSAVPDSASTFRDESTHTNVDQRIFLGSGAVNHETTDGIKFSPYCPTTKFPDPYAATDSTQYLKRKLEAVDPSDSDEEYADIALESIIDLTPTDSKTSNSIQSKTSGRPRREGVNCGPTPQSPDGNHDDSKSAQVTELSTKTARTVTKIAQSTTSTDSIISPPQVQAHTPSNNLPLDLPRPDDGESCPSYVKCDANERSEVSLEDIDMSMELSSDRLSTHNEEGESTPIPPPAPQHGYLGIADAYRENTPVLNAPRWVGSAIVWDNYGHPDSCRVLFDSESKPNFISWKLALRLGFQPTPLPREQWKLFSSLDSQKDLVQYYTKLDIEMRYVNFDRKTTYFLVVETNEIDIVLSRHFLGESGIAKRLVANAQPRTTSNAITIITSNPTSGIIPLKAYPVVRIPLTYIIFPEQVRSVLLDKERRKKLAERADANIQEQTSMTSSFGHSSADNSWSRDSSPTHSTHSTLATTFSSEQSTGSSSLSSLGSMKKILSISNLLFNSKRKEKEQE
jgi:hypothetical protein